jgi:hypothetical protein
MKSLIIGILLGATLRILVQCNTETRTPRNIVVLIDLSSSRNSSVQQWYIWVIKAVIFPSLKKDDHITIIPVDRNSLTASKEILSIDFSKFHYGNEYNGLQGDQVENKNHQDSIRAITARLDPSFAATVRERIDFQKGTDIFNALKGSKRYLVPNSRNILILLCDMQQYTDKNTMNFEDHLNQQADVEKFLQKSDSIDLVKAKIIVLTGHSSNISAKKFGALRSFWEGFFAKSNCELLDYSSESVEILKNILQTSK